MSNENDIRRGRHCVFLMHVHLVFVTKYRREAFTKVILDDLRGIFANICATSRRNWWSSTARTIMCTCW